MVSAVNRHVASPSLPCVYALFRLISIARYVFKSPSICFRETKYEIYREHVGNLHSML